MSACIFQIHHSKLYTTVNTNIVWNYQQLTSKHSDTDTHNFKAELLQYIEYIYDPDFRNI